MSDHDDDDRLSLAEWRGKEWLVYSQFDHDRSGQLDAREFDDKHCGGLGADIPSQPPQRLWCLASAAREFRRLSGRHGGITAESLAGQARRGFQFNDLNRDGFVTREEMRRAIQRHR
ncbi:hypothetical protein [Brevundimonas sp.]|uniref:hypothetical protein n=1 Tax=Brevundimonas sp. TaxID=1871086 RepID=UPI0035677893